MDSFACITALLLLDLCWFQTIPGWIILFATFGTVNLSTGPVSICRVGTWVALPWKDT